MKRFLDLLRQPQPASADLRRALDQVDVPAAQAEHDRLKAERAALLMEGDDRTLDALEARIAAAARQIERAEILRGQLGTAIGAAEAREAAEALTAERAAVEAEAAATAKALRTAYPKIATELVALLDRLEAAEVAVKAINKKLTAAGRLEADRVAEVETRAFPLGPHQYGPDKSILGRITLAEKPGLCPGYNDRPDTGGWVIQNPTGAGVAMDFGHAVSGPSQPFGSYVDASAGA